MADGHDERLVQTQDMFWESDVFRYSGICIQRGEDLIRKISRWGVLLTGFLFAVVLAGTSECWALQPGDPVNGKVIFGEYCSACHGMNGDGKGPAAPAAHEPPANFTDPDFWKGKTDAFLIHVIRRGFNGMPPYWDVMSKQDILDVYSYVKTFRKS